MAGDTLVYTVPTISCGHCTQAIEERVGPLEGVSSVVANSDTKLVTVIGGDSAAITAAIKAAGYEVTSTAPG